MTRRGTVRIAREVFLSAGALLGVVCVLATVAGAALGIKPLVFRSGSMSPAIGVGDLAVSQTVDASSLKRGDIVSVVNGTGNRVTHRVVNVASQGAARQLTLKGDANRSPDVEVYTVTRAEKVLFDVPKAGYVVDAATSPVGLFVLGLYVAGMLTVLFRRPPGGPGEHDRRPGGARRADVARSGRVASRSTIAMAAAATMLAANPASAAWVDPVDITNANYSAHALVPPSSLTCSGGGLLSSLTYTWPNTDLRYEYVVTLENSSGTVVRTDVVANSGSLATNQSITYTFTLLNGFFGVPATLTVRVRPRLTATPLWSSSTSTTATGRLLSLGIVGLGSSCT